MSYREENAFTYKTMIPLSVPRPCPVCIFSSIPKKGGLGLHPKVSGCWGYASMYV